eukprot:1143716-Prorocentrum_minimum.AAC.1
MLLRARSRCVRRLRAEGLRTSASRCTPMSPTCGEGGRKGVKEGVRRGSGGGQGGDLSIKSRRP